MSSKLATRSTFVRIDSIVVLPDVYMQMLSNQLGSFLCIEEHEEDVEAAKVNGTEIGNEEIVGETRVCS